MSVTDISLYILQESRYAACSYGAAVTRQRRPCRSPASRPALRVGGEPTVVGLGSPFGSYRGSDVQVRRSGTCFSMTRCRQGSGSQQIVKYRSDLQKLSCVTVGAREWRHSDVIGLRAAIGLDLGKQ